jgi:hypothetical protein
VEVGEISIRRPAGQEGGTQSGYSAQTNPFELDSRLQEIYNGTSGEGMQFVERLFARLHQGGSDGVTVSAMTGLPPRTAAESFAQGGDCTDLAGIITPMLRRKGILGGVLVVHFDSAPAGVEHMVPYVEDGGARTIVDLQAERLGQTAQGRYTVILNMSYEQAASMYHREMGDYYRDQGRSQDAINAYRRAVEIFDRDPYVHQNLGVLYERAGDMEAAGRHSRRAAELDPQRYGGHGQRGSYNQELQAADRAMQESRWSDCVRHLQAALDSGERIGADERRTIESNIRACRQRAGQ